MSQIGGRRGQEKDWLRRDPGLYLARVRSRPRPGTLKPTLPRHTAGPPPGRRLGSPLRPGPPTWPDVGPGPRPRCSAPRRRPAPTSRAPRPGCPAGSAGRATTSPWQPGGGSGLAARLATRRAGAAGPEVPRRVRAPLTGPGPHDAWAGFEAPPGPNLDPSVEGGARPAATATRPPDPSSGNLRMRASRPGLRGPPFRGIRLCCPRGCGVRLV